jgi:hypothetical protein
MDVDQIFFRYDRAARAFRPVASTLDDDRLQAISTSFTAIVDAAYRREDTDADASFCSAQVPDDPAGRVMVIRRVPDNSSGRLAAAAHVLVGENLPAMALVAGWQGWRREPDPDRPLTRLAAGDLMAEARQGLERALGEIADLDPDRGGDQELVRLVDALLRVEDGQLAVWPGDCGPVALLSGARAILQEFVCADWSFSTGEPEQKAGLRITFMLPGGTIHSDGRVDLRRNPESSPFLGAAQALVAAYRQAPDNKAWSEDCAEAGVTDRASLLAWARAGARQRTSTSLLKAAEADAKKALERAGQQWERERAELAAAGEHAAAEARAEREAREVAEAALAAARSSFEEERRADRLAAQAAGARALRDKEEAAQAAAEQAAREREEAGRAAWAQASATYEARTREALADQAGERAAALRTLDDQWRTYVADREAALSAEELRRHELEAEVARLEGLLAAGGGLSAAQTAPDQAESGGPVPDGEAPRPTSRVLRAVPSAPGQAESPPPTPARQAQQFDGTAQLEAPEQPEGTEEPDGTAQLGRTEGADGTGQRGDAEQLEPGREAEGPASGRPAPGLPDEGASPTYIRPDTGLASADPWVPPEDTWYPGPVADPSPPEPDDQPGPAGRRQGPEPAVPASSSSRPEQVRKRKLFGRGGGSHQADTLLLTVLTFGLVSMLALLSDLLR